MIINGDYYSCLDGKTYVKVAPGRIEYTFK
jgi:hypothetical protein